MRCFGWTVLMAILLLSSIYAHAGDEFKSPSGQNAIFVEQDGIFKSAYIRSDKQRRAIFSRLPSPGSIEVNWLNEDTARLDAPCGTACTATFFASKAETIGPLAEVLSANALQGFFTSKIGPYIEVRSLKPSFQIIGRLLIPQWCKNLVCKYREGYIDNHYIFSYRGKKTSVVLDGR